MSRQWQNRNVWESSASPTEKSGDGIPYALLCRVFPIAAFFPFSYICALMNGMRTYNVAIVGATGLVGRTMLQVLAERAFPIRNLRLFASARSAGQQLHFRGQVYPVEELNENTKLDNLDLALFSAGRAVSQRFAPQFVHAGCTVIDNSSAWRMAPNIPLIIPEVNAHHLSPSAKIIANPNCSTIQLLVVIAPIHRALGLKEVVVATYQSPSGAGYRGLQQLEAELQQQPLPDPPAFPHPIAYNTVFHSIDPTTGMSEEELKMRNETRKILDDPGFILRVTCVRVPIRGGHAEAVHFITQRQSSVAEIAAILEASPGVHLVATNTEYPMPITAEGSDEVFVGRIRQEDSEGYRFALWIVADNIRKGAATNAVQIAERWIALQ